MSSVTNVMVACAIVEDDETVALLGERIHADRPGTDLLCLTSGAAQDYWGGGKHPEVVVWAAAFNYVAPQDVIEFVQRIPWRYPEDVQVFIQDQHEDHFSVYAFRQGELVQVL